MSELLQRVQTAVGDAYTLERELEGGGMSHLFLATESSLNRKVVIKLLPPDHASAVSAARFQQEIELTASLVHPHILPVLGAGAEDGILYYVMPFVSGESLRKRLDQEESLPVEEGVRLLAEIADALAFAHGKDVIHRDIKPENILLEGRHAVLADFGIARALLKARTGERLTETGASVGTPGYMAPEQMAGDSVDARADLYSLATVGYEMLSGAPPFSGKSAQALLTAHLTTVPQPLHELRPEVPVSISAIIQRALSKDPEDRFETAAEFADALAGAPLVSPGPSARSGSRRSFRIPLVMAAVVGLVGVVGWGALVVRERVRAGAVLEDLAPMVDAGNLDGVAEAVVASEVDLEDGVFSSLLPRVAGFLSVASEGEDVAVTLTRVSPVETFEEHQTLALGRTPVGYRPVVAGEYLVRYEAPGGFRLSRLVDVAVGDSVHLVLPVPAPADLVAGYLPVSAGPTADGETVPAFLIGQTEVTNREYSRFIDAGGYRDPSLWPERMRLGGEALSREVALSRLVDRTGLPGPRSWSSGRPPDGRLDHPVTGVSWYEARAYAHWHEGSLPTRAQWYRAALGDGSAPYPWGTEGDNVEVRANFGFAGTAPVGSHPLGVSRFGVQDMAGNVREWVGDEVPGSPGRLVVGGSWRDPAYMFQPGLAEEFDPGTADGTIGIRVVRPSVVR